ncbi:MAG TPA: CidA/LrgA family protein [Acidisarcina sp.]|nr:CidA/LrgA family protein [Acidisarcina sp.]
MTLRFYKRIRFEHMIDYLRGFSIVVGFLSLGSLLHRLGIPIPGGVLGLIVFYLAMSTGLIKLKWMERTANLLLRNMVLMFVPLTVGLMDMGPLLSRQALAMSASLVVSLVAVLLTTGVLGRWLLPTESIQPEFSAHTVKHEATEDGQ